MPRLPPPPPPPRHWPQALSAAFGPTKDDFYVLGHNREFDEAFEAVNLATLLSPTSYFTHVLHFADGRKDRVYRVPDRILKTWWSPARQLGYAVGFPRGVFEIGPGGVGEVVLDDHEGVFFGLWGTADDQLFACGVRPFALHRRDGSWRELPLPHLRTEHLHDICGGAADDVYFVGGEGTILHFDGTVVALLEAPTTRNLLSIEALGGGRYCIGGAGGTLLYGSRSGWRLVASRVEDDLFFLASLQGQVFYASLAGLYSFDGVAPPRLVIDRPFDSVSSLGHSILLTHETSAWLYDGAGLVELDTTV